MSDPPLWAKAKDDQCESVRWLPLETRLRCVRLKGHAGQHEANIGPRWD